MDMEIESVKCECCGMTEDCTQEYISSVKDDFDGLWLCGLCAEAVRDEAEKEGCEIEEAVKAHMDFCGNYKTNPAVRVAEGMKQMLRRLSFGSTASSPKKPAGSSQAEDESSGSYQVGDESDDSSESD